MTIKRLNLAETLSEELSVIAGKADYLANQLNHHNINRLAFNHYQKVIWNILSELLSIERKMK